MSARRVAVTGASGFIGSALVASLRADGLEVITVGRARRSAGRAAAGERGNMVWDPAGGVLHATVLEGVDAVVHLAGETIAQRWTPAAKRRIRDSRVIGTRLIAETMARLDKGPRVLIVSSATGYYGSRGDEWLDEGSAPGTDFLAEATGAWERAADAARAAGVRVVHVRTGLAMSPRGGALAKLLTPFRFGVGGRLGDGRQWMSWIALDDLVAVFRFALDTDVLTGAVNAVSPSPVTNAEFTSTLARALSRPAVMTLPAIALRALFGEMAVGTLLASQRARPLVLERAGFRFAYPVLEDALRHVLGR